MNVRGPQSRVPYHRRVLYVRGFEGDLKDQFKAACCRRGRTMKNVLEEFMLEYVRRDTPVMPRRAEGGVVPPPKEIKYD